MTDELAAVAAILVLLSGYGLAIGIVLTVAYHFLRFTGVLPL